MKLKAKPSKHNKNPQQHKTKEEMLRDLRLNPEFRKKMEFIREKFYPTLCEATTSIADASFLLQGFNNQIMEQFLSRMKDIKTSELDLYTKLDHSAEKYEDYKRIIDLFQDMNIFETKEYIEGMRQEIETFKADEMKERPLSSLKTKWIDEL